MSRKTFGGWGFAPDPDWEAHIAPQTPSYLRGGGRGGKGREGEGKGMGRGGEGCAPPFRKSWIRP